MIHCRKTLKPLSSVIILITLNLSALPLHAQAPPDLAKDKQPYVAPDAKNKSARSSDAGSDPTAPNQATQIKTPSDFRIGEADELVISVWHEPEFSQSVVVRPDGMITLPLLNEIKVAGLTTTEMQALLTEKMKSMVNDPQVTVILRAINSRKVWLVGNVGRQGAYQLIDKKTLLELISEAGGLGPFAKMRAIYILRQVNGKKVRIGFDYKKAITGKGDNPFLEPGDMVVVP